MKSIIKYSLSALLAVLLTGCLDDAVATSYVTQDEIDNSSKGGDALFWAMPSMLNYTSTLPTSDMAYDYGYGSIMHVRDVLTEDMPVESSSYEWYTAWQTNSGNGNYTVAAQLVWWYMYKLVQSTNKSVQYYANTGEDDGRLGSSLAFRAAAYLDLARMYEFLPNDAVSSVNAYGNNVLGLTVPIVTDSTTLSEARNNPRATREEMKAFILSDLDRAEELTASFSRPAKTVPNLGVVYGLKARLYMWVEDYENARIYARKAISASGATPLTESEWLNTTSGFNDISYSSWMWGAQQVAEDASVQSKYYNWTSWMCNENNFGYTYYGPKVMINAATYNRISDTDFRKLSWIAPEDSELSGKEPLVDESFRDTFSSYYSLKFRPAEGNYSDYTIGAVSDYPLMRVEEMYFIEAEAAAHTNPAEGKELLETFMRTYRDANYTCNVSSINDVVEEIVFQKRIELWGEGQTFFDVKRLNMSVTRSYEGTNFAGNTRMNTNGRPAWMNLVMLRFEGDNNSAVTEWNNPDTDGCYSVIETY
jgi:tetratricopeptide (TPR) repeat protein